jgi:hypothetical protein
VIPVDSSLRVFRRERGSIRATSKGIGVSSATLQRAETGRPVSSECRERIEAAFALPLKELQKPFLDAILEQLNGD